MTESAMNTGPAEETPKVTEAPAQTAAAPAADHHESLKNILDKVVEVAQKVDAVPGANQAVNELRTLVEQELEKYL